MRIGLPRALSYYEYGFLWRAFFEALGATVVVSGPTTRAVLEIATTQATADLCLPTKVYLGHLLELVDAVDMVFVPSLRRPAPAATHCAKIIGLPDLARSVVPDSSKVMEVELDLDKGRLALAQAVWAAGRPLTWNPVQIARAADTAWEKHKSARRGLKNPCSDAAASVTLAVVGHPYLLRDEYVNHRLLTRLEQYGVCVLTSDMLPQAAADWGVNQLGGHAYWAYAPSLLGAGVSLLASGLVNGLLAVVAFGCAPDSGLAPVLNQAARRAGVPMLTLTLDEHGGEAGIITRLEAFVDMLERKRHNG